MFEKTQIKREQLKFIKGNYYDLEFNFMSYNNSKPKLEIRQLKKEKKSSVTLTAFELKQLLEALEERKR